MSSSEEESDQEVEDEFYQAFGDHTGISNDFREAIDLIKDNSNQIDEVDIGMIAFLLLVLAKIRHTSII